MLNSSVVKVHLLPAGCSPLIAVNTLMLLLHVLATSARTSLNITIVLLEVGIVDTLYQILTGVLPFRKRRTRCALPDKVSAADPPT